MRKMPPAPLTSAITIGEDWQNRHLYHLMISSCLGEKEAVSIILSALHSTRAKVCSGAEACPDAGDANFDSIVQRSPASGQAPSAATEMHHYAGKMPPKNRNAS